jgi:hypothetical protein
LKEHNQSHRLGAGEDDTQGKGKDKGRSRYGPDEDF